MRRAEASRHRERAEARRIATLALDARAKGKLTTAQVIARFEEVTRLDAGVSRDWVELGRLYADSRATTGCSARSAGRGRNCGR